MQDNRSGPTNSEGHSLQTIVLLKERARHFQQDTDLFCMRNEGQTAEAYKAMKLESLRRPALVNQFGEGFLCLIQ